MTHERGVLFEEIAKKFGTPLYVYSEATILQKVSELKAAFAGTNASFCYAVKANSNLSILKLLSDQGFGFDIVSEGELRRVLRAGGAMSSVVYSGVGKGPDEIRAALSNKIKFLNIESPAELYMLDAIAKELGVRAQISLRINPDIDVHTHPYLATGLKTSKFGMPLSDALLLREDIAKSKFLDLCGIDCHIGSQVSELSAWEGAHLEMLKAAGAFEESGFTIRYIDLGGGFPICYTFTEQALNLAAFAQLFKRAECNKYQYIFEPGRFVVAEAGQLITSVVLTKKNHDKNFVIVDAGMNDLIRPALYEAYHEIEALTHNASGKTFVADVVGPVCETGCYLGLERKLPEVNSGDLMAINNAGAYGFSMASNYNSRRLPAEVLVAVDGSYKLIRPRQDFEELWAGE